MKITSIETHVCHARMRNWIFVKVLTDQPGLYGWGEATLEWHTKGVLGSIEDVAELIIRCMEPQHENRTYTIVDDPIPFNRFVASIMRTTGRPRPVLHLPVRPLAAIADWLIRTHRW